MKVSPPDGAHAAGWAAPVHDGAPIATAANTATMINRFMSLSLYSAACDEKGARDDQKDSGHRHDVVVTGSRLDTRAARWRRVGRTGAGRRPASSCSDAALQPDTAEPDAN